MWKDVVISESYQKGHTFKEALENNFKNCDITYDDKYVWVIVDNEGGDVDSVYTTEMKLVDIYEDLKTKIEEKVLKESSFDDLLDKIDHELEKVINNDFEAYKTLVRALDYAIKYTEGLNRKDVISEEKRQELLEKLDSLIYWKFYREFEDLSSTSTLIEKIF